MTDNNTQGSTSTRPLLSSADEEVKEHVQILEEAFRSVRPGIPIPKDDIAVLVQDVEYGRYLKSLAGTRPRQIIQSVDKHILLSKEFLSSTSGSLDPPKRKDNLDIQEIIQQSMFEEGVKRISDVDKDEALKRDGYKRVLTGMANPELAHIFPHSALGERPKAENQGNKKTKNPGDNRAIMSACWDVTATMVDRDFHDIYKKNIDDINDHGFEFPSNVVSIAPHMHNWLDRGFWSFRMRADTEDDGVEFTWLPGDFCDEKKFPEKVSDVNEYIELMLEVLENRRQEGFPARTPSAGWIGTHTQDDRLLRTGDVITIHHATPANRVFFRDMVRLQWECMVLLTLRGVTKGDGSRPDGKNKPGKHDLPDSQGKPRKSVRLEETFKGLAEGFKGKMNTLRGV
ncbi:hypothetical protein ACHAP8_010437 [Fusarium lateritium]